MRFSILENVTPLGPRKQAKDSRKSCERGVPGNFYLAQHSYINVDQISVLDSKFSSTFVSIEKHPVFDSLADNKYQTPMISSRNDCPYHPWDRKTG